MAAIDYYAILEKIQTTLVAASATFTNNNTRVEYSEPVAAEVTPFITINGTGRQVADSDQVISAGTRLRVIFNVTITVYAFRLGYDGDGLRAAISQRNDVIGEIETILMQNLDLGNTIEFLRINGGEFETINEGRDAFTAGEILLDVVVSATT